MLKYNGFFVSKKIIIKGKILGDSDFVTILNYRSRDRNMVKLFNKIAIVFMAVALSFSFAAVSFNTSVDARVRAKIDVGRDSVNTDYYDAAKLVLGATVDNVSASLTISRDDDVPGGNALKVDGFNLTVSDIASGLLSLRFFDVDMSAGSSFDESDFIISDNTAQGVYFTIKPVDIFSLGFGYGVNGSDENVRHMFKLNFDIGGPVPTSIYFGTYLNNGGTVDTIQTAGEDTPDDESDDEFYKKAFNVERMQVGVQADLYQGWANLGVGATLPLGSALAYVEELNGELKYELVVVAGVWGSIPVLDTGLSIGYSLFYITDSYIKQQTDLVTYTDSLRVKIKPAYSIGFLSVSALVGVYMGEQWEGATATGGYDATATNDVKTTYADASIDTANLRLKPADAEVVNNPIRIEFEPAIKFTFAPGMSVTFLYELIANDVAGAAEDTETTLAHTLGMNVAASFGISQD